MNWQNEARPFGGPRSVSGEWETKRFSLTVRSGIDTAIFAAAAVASRHEKGRGADDAIFNSVNRSFAKVRRPFWLVTQGGWFGLVPVWVGLAWLTGRRRLAADILGAALLSWVMSQGAKELLPLERPWERLEEIHRIGGTPWGSSFPSGHPAVSFAIAAVLEREEDLPRGLKLFARSWASGVAFSRMVVGAHYPLDVIGGSALGDLAGITWSAISDRVAGRTVSAAPGDDAADGAESASSAAKGRPIESPTEESPSPDDGAALEMR